MNIYNKIIQGNRYEVMIANNTNWLWDETLQRIIATSKDANELILYAQHNNMISADAVIIQ